MEFSLLEMSGVVNALLSLYSLAVDTLLRLYTFTLHKALLNSWYTLVEWGEKGPILPTPFKCFQGEKGPIQLLEEVLWGGEVGDKQDTALVI